MTAAQLLRALAQRDVQLQLVGDALRVNAPRGVVVGELRAALQRSKPEIQQHLRARAAEPILVDFETRSRLSLRKVSGRIYAAHPSTEMVCAVAKMPDGTFLECGYGEGPPAPLLDAVVTGSPLMAHNGLGFDKFIWNALGWPRGIWIDTMPLARLAGLPAGLDHLSEHLLSRKKDRAGQLATLRLSRLDKNGQLPPITAADLAAALAYCRTDVELLDAIWRKALLKFRDADALVRALDTTINDRGFSFDGALAEALIDCEAAEAEELRVAAGVDLRLVRSAAKFIPELARRGVAVLDMKHETLEGAHKGQPNMPAPARKLIEARVASAGIATSKLRAGLDNMGEDGRIRDTLTYHGAHTGRWTGEDFQPQNLPRGGKEPAGAPKLDREAAVKAALARDHAGLKALAATSRITVRDVAASLVRACICAPPGRLLAVADYSTVEPRVLAWIAGNEDRLKQFRAGVDIYKPMAAKLFRIAEDEVTKPQRNAGKPVELGCGYGMGADNFAGYAEGYGVDWSTMPMTPKEVVDLWRDENPLVAGVFRRGSKGRRGGLWQRLEEAAMRACLGDRVEDAYTTWARDGADVVCVLPSGRRMVYRDAGMEATVTHWGETRDAMTYLAADKGRVVRKSTYGGLLTENVVQAICRDILAEAMVQLDRAGFAIVLHVHDEAVAEVADASDLERLIKIMTTPPPWAAGVPLAAEGYVDSRYRGK